MVTASVGFQCPDCTHEGAQKSQTIDPRSLKTTPIVTYVLIGMNAAVFLLGLVYAGGSNFLANDFGLASQCVAHGQWWRLITGGFLHGGMLHLLMNMWALYIIGTVLEQVLGRGRYLLLYAVSLMGGALGVVIVDMLGSPSLTVGASGGIFGLFGALLVVQRSRGIGLMQSGLAWIIGLNLLITFTIPNISIGGHIGGLIAGGAAAAIMLAGKPMVRQTDSERLSRASVIGVLIIGCGILALVLAGSVDPIPAAACAIS
jgi:membrane associated rhomboid family serine protease